LGDKGGESKLVNYGYGPTSKGWKDDRKYKLAEAFRDLLIDLKLTRNDEVESGDTGMLHNYPEPYVEVDNLYEGVRIRKITNLTEEQMDQLIPKAEEIYKKIMWT
jgi:hypothetical protein